MIEFMAARRDAVFTGITIAGVSFLFMSFVASNSWSVIYAQAILILHVMHGLFSNCWFNACAKNGPKDVSSSGGTPGFVVGECCVGANVMK